MPHRLEMIQPRNARGEIRKLGVELEFHGLETHAVATIVQNRFGGQRVQLDNKQWNVVQTRFGTFKVERDSHWLKEYERRREPEEDMDAFSYVAARAEDMWRDVLESVVPVELVTPPIPHTSIADLEDLREDLRQAGALGTNDSFLYAFGVHFNIETPETDAQTLLAYLQAFLLLQPWLQERVSLDHLRRILPYANSFPDRYAEKVLAADYAPDTQQLIGDYIQANPTRNRGLDFLPLFSFVDEAAVSGQVEDEHLVSKRPAFFHYRLPNCHISNHAWNLASDWQLWLVVEQVACKPELRPKRILSCVVPP